MVLTPNARNEFWILIHSTTFKPKEKTHPWWLFVVYDVSSPNPRPKFKSMIAFVAISDSQNRTTSWSSMDMPKNRNSQSSPNPPPRVSSSVEEIQLDELLKELLSYNYSSENVNKSEGSSQTTSKPVTPPAGNVFSSPPPSNAVEPLRDNAFPGNGFKQNDALSAVSFEQRKASIVKTSMAVQQTQSAWNNSYAHENNGGIYAEIQETTQLNQLNNAAGYPASMNTTRANGTEGYPVKQEVMSQNGHAGYVGKQEVMTQNGHVGYVVKQEVTSENGTVGYPVNQVLMLQSRTEKNDSLRGSQELMDRSRTSPYYVQNREPSPSDGKQVEYASNKQPFDARKNSMYTASQDSMVMGNAAGLGYQGTFQRDDGFQRTSGLLTSQPCHGGNISGYTRQRSLSSSQQLESDSQVHDMRSFNKTLPAQSFEFDRSGVGVGATDHWKHSRTVHRQCASDSEDPVSWLEEQRWKLQSKREGSPQQQNLMHQLQQQQQQLATTTTTATTTTATTATTTTTTATTTATTATTTATTAAAATTIWRTATTTKVCTATTTTTTTAATIPAATAAAATTTSLHAGAARAAASAAAVGSAATNCACSARLPFEQADSQRWRRHLPPRSKPHKGSNVEIARSRFDRPQLSGWFVRPFPVPGGIQDARHLLRSVSNFHCLTGNDRVQFRPSLSDSFQHPSNH